jgi:hypothetical protein
MQKVVGSNPISRFRKGQHLQVFFTHAVGWCVCVPGQCTDNRRCLELTPLLRRRLFAGDPEGIGTTERLRRQFADEEPSSARRRRQGGRGAPLGQYANARAPVRVESAGKSEAGVDHLGLARDVAGGVAQEEDHGHRNVSPGRAPSQRRVLGAAAPRSADPRLS